MPLPLNTSITVVPVAHLLAILALPALSWGWIQPELGRITVQGPWPARHCCYQPCPPRPTLTVRVTTDSVTVLVHNLIFDAVPSSTPLDRVLQRAHAYAPSDTSVALEVDDEVSHEQLISVIDACIGAGMPTVFVGALSN